MACARPARVSIRTSESSDVGAPATSEAVSTLWMSGRGRKWYRALVSTVHQCDISYLPTRRDAFRACNILTIRELVEDAGFEIEIVAGARGGSAGPAAPRRDRAHVVQGHRALRVRRARLGRDAAVAPHGVDQQQLLEQMRGRDPVAEVLQRLAALLDARVLLFGPAGQLVVECVPAPAGEEGRPAALRLWKAYATSAGGPAPAGFFTAERWAVSC